MKKSFKDHPSLPLTDLAVGQKAKIAYLHTHPFNIVQKIIAMGLLPKKEIILVQKFPSYVLKIGKTQFAIDQAVAEKIFVQIK